ncbi:MAG: inorganic phosphate transporter [Bacteroidota bacterium]
MIILFYLSSGLFLGWSLGANDAANIFGTAVGTRMIKFKTAAITASIFVILGAVIQGAGANSTLGKLGSISTLAGAFTVALAAALTVYWMTRMKLPVSTSQSIVGAIIGWNFYTNNATDVSTLTKIVTTWVSGPILGGLTAILLYMLVKGYTKKAKVHLLYRDSFIRYGLLVVGAFGAYSLGANNIANVMGVFTSAVTLPSINLGFIQFDSTQQLFFIGGIAIAIGIFTYSRHVMATVGNTLMPLTSEAAIVVVLSQAIVLFIFSSQGLSDAVQSIGLPAIPLVPVSSSQVVIGSIIGIGLYKGGKEIKYKILGSISLGWVATPVLAGILTFFMLFFVNNVFKGDVGGDRNLMSSIEAIVNDTDANREHKPATVFQDTSAILQPEASSPDKAEVSGKKRHTASGNSTIIYWIGISILIIISLFLLYQLWKLINKHRLLKLQARSDEKKYLLQIDNLENSIKNNIHRQNDLDKELKFRQNEMVTMAMSIIRKNQFLNDLKDEVVQIKSSVKEHETRLGLNKLSLMITQDLSIDRDREKFQMHINEQNSNFIHRISEAFPSMTENEKRLAVLLRLNLSSKEIASILNISPKSVEMNRYRLRKKLKVDPKLGLNDFIREF